MTLSRPQVHELLSRWGLQPRRRYGQNFVADPNTVRRVARLAGIGPGSRVVEVGAGLGSLTLALAETGAEVTAVEVDSGLAGVLREVVAATPGVTVVEADAMTLDWHALLARGTNDATGDGGDRGWVLVANLPYNVATPLICDLLDDVPELARMLVMVQREVAERFAATPGTAAYGAVSIKTAYWASARLVGTVPASVFVPRPNVESALVEIVRHPAGTGPACSAPDRMFTLVREAFNQRRKMLRRSLEGTVTPGEIEAAGIDPAARPESLGVAAWCRLADAHPTATAGPGDPMTDPPEATS